MSAIDPIQTGEALEARGEFLDALAAYQSALSHSDPAVAADAHFHVGRVSWKQSRLDEAMQQYAAARALAIQHGHSELRARVENGIGAIHYNRGEFEQARAAYSVALELTQDDAQRGRVQLNLGAIANIQGDLDGARKSYQQSRSLFRDAGYRRGEILALHNLGMLYADEDRWDAADEAFRDCLVLLEAEHDRAMIAKVLVSRSEVSCTRSRFDEAVAACDQAIAISDELGDEVQRIEAVRWKGRALAGLGRHDEAQRGLQTALRVAHRLQLRLNEAELLYEMGNSFDASGAQAEARSSLSRALALFEELGAQREVDELRARLGS